jgi:hypothetical protein
MQVGMTVLKNRLQAGQLVVDALLAGSGMQVHMPGLQQNSSDRGVDV